MISADLFLMKISMFLRSSKRGFTIIELLVTVSLLVILLSIAIASFGPAREKSRDTQRQTDLRTIEAALALYKNKYGVYPEGCNGPTTSATPVWSGQLGSDYECTSGGRQFIIGLAPEFLPKLPIDPKLNGTDSGYVYAVNSERSVYKVMALNTVETEVVGYGDEFFRCGQEFNPVLVSTDSSVGASYNDPEICERVPPTLPGGYNPGGYTAPTVCTGVDGYGATYAVSAGFSNDARGLSGVNANKGREYDTENVRCR